ncbi:LuxR C-terminal-related transcriptional regulator [Leptolyngbya sp. CCNP1308]|uniref:helix-turn-helix transcriptional regulator n=1 Tax=Leptolyngbya sp. CCNP1308 TaxID=3110255 RepID=UPI002B1F3B8F|nr:LuxR C-terminal-related transcriptional regulator [Leptolyngbya sp. CCNP1308]MEA5451789.1 LuxR C-terminal-related transcriptional regulator [Leptolyngbya sp. CCNP1308]
MVTLSLLPTVADARPDRFSESQEEPRRAELAVLSRLFEGFADGVLLLTQEGSCLYSNEEGRRLCQVLKEGQHSADALPLGVWLICRHMIESRSLFTDEALVPTQTLTGAKDQLVRAKVQWLDLPPDSDAYLLVLLEDQSRSAQATALLEAVRYKLTPREKDVWLLRHANCSYKEIAAKLFVSVNTVKRHLKSISAKRTLVLEG